MPSSCKRTSATLNKQPCFADYGICGWRELLTLPFRLMKEASINAKQAGERGISAKSVKKVTEVSIPELSAMSLL
jgi:hypothetical protein